jgi:hypothetical protein
MESTRIDDFEVHRVAEFEGPFVTPAEFFPDFDPEVVRADAELLGPRLINRASGHHTILINSCLGNDNERLTRPLSVPEPDPRPEIDAGRDFNSPRRDRP